MNLETRAGDGEPFLPTDDEITARYNTGQDARQDRLDDFLPVVRQQVVPKKDDVEVLRRRRVGRQVVDLPPDALPQLVAKDVISVFEKYKVLNARELHSRYEIMLETYNKVVNVEGQLMVLMANRYILPAALEYQKQVAQSVAAVKQAGGTAVESKKVLGGITKLTDEFKKRTDKLQAALGHNGNGDAVKHAKHFRDAVIPAMQAVRDTSDRLECLIPHELWPLATYRGVLFIK